MTIAEILNAHHGHPIQICRFEYRDESRVELAIVCIKCDEKLVNDYLDPKTDYVEKEPKKP